MYPFRWRLWRFAWSQWDDLATETTFGRRGETVARAWRLFLGLWFFTLAPPPVLRLGRLRVQFRGEGWRFYAWEYRPDDNPRWSWSAQFATVSFRWARSALPAAKEDPTDG